MTPSEYFQEHTIDEAFAKKTFALLWDNTKITIPVYDIKGKLLFCRYRQMEGSAKFTADRGSHPALFAIHKVKKESTVVLCEGEPDCIRLWQEGIPAVTGTSGVKTFSEKIAAPLKGKQVLIVLDNDEAGRSAVEHYYKVLEKVGADPMIIDLPEEYKDVCEYFSAGFTKSDFDQLIRYVSLDSWLDAHEPEEYDFEEGTELLAKPLPPEEWLVDRILPAEGFAFIVGAEATGKSFYTLTLAHSVTTKTPWLNKFPVTQKKRVLIIDKENTKRRVQSRMKGLSMDGKDIFWLKYPHFFELSDSTQEDGFSKIAHAAARKVKKYDIDLIIVDAFTDVMIGNENAAGDVQRFFDGFRQLFPNKSILVLHHASKPAQGVFRTSAQRARGSTNIMAQIYSGFYVEAVPKSKNEFIIEQTKAGDAEKLNKFSVELVSAPDPTNPDKTIVTKIEYKGEVYDAEMKVTEAVSFIEEAFKSTTMIARQEMTDILSGHGVSKGTMERAIKQLADAGVIESVQDEHQKNKRNYVWLGSVKEEIYEE